MRGRSRRGSGGSRICIIPPLPYFGGTETPTLLVWGTQDEVVPRGCDEVQEGDRRAKVATIEGAGIGRK